MIYVTVGLSTHTFDRLFMILDELCNEQIIDSNELVVQAGYTSYRSKKYKMFDMIDYDRQQEYITNADFIITHAGTGSIINCLKANKKIIIFPRRMQYLEHVDDHQIEIADFFSNNGCAKLAYNKEELIACINDIRHFSPNEFVSNNKHINQLLVKYIDSV